MDKNDVFWRELGFAIQSERLAKRLTQQELADRISTTRTCVANWESGRRKINIVELQKVCKALDADTNEMLEKVSQYIK